MDTDQVLSLIEGLGEKAIPMSSFSPIPPSFGCSSMGLSMPSVASIEDSLNALADAHAEDAERRRPHPPNLSSQLRMDGSSCVAAMPCATVPQRQHAPRPEEVSLGVFL